MNMPKRMHYINALKEKLPGGDLGEFPKMLILEYFFAVADYPDLGVRGYRQQLATLAITAKATQHSATAYVMAAASELLHYVTEDLREDHTLSLGAALERYLGDIHNTPGCQKVYECTRATTDMQNSEFTAFRDLFGLGPAVVNDGLVMSFPDKKKVN